MKTRITWTICFAILSIVLLNGCGGGGQLDPKVMSNFHSSRYCEALKQVQPHTRNPENRNYTLNQLRLAALARYAACNEQALESFLAATARMENFEPDGEFKARVGAEDVKDYLGDPYEQMYAFFYLGMLDYQAGRYDMAVADFKTSLLCDVGSREDRYQADSSLVYYMMGRAYQRQGRSENARECFDDAKNVVRFHSVYDVAVKALDKAYAQLREGENSEKKQEILDLAHEILTRELTYTSKGADDVNDAIIQAGDSGPATITYFCEHPSKSDDSAVWRNVRKVKEDVILGVVALSDKAQELLPEIDDTDENKQFEQFSRAVDDISVKDHNLSIMLELGDGPVKIRQGVYGHLVGFTNRHYSERFARIQIDGREIEAIVQLDDVYYQAKTRGGRAMDDILEGRAKFKDVSQAVGFVALGMSNEFAHHGNHDAAAVAAVAGVAMLFASELTRPEADIRYWEFLPGDILMASAKVEPGSHTLTIDYLTAEGNVIAGLRQELNDIIVSADAKDNLYIVRSGQKYSKECQCDLDKNE